MTVRNAVAVREQAAAEVADRPPLRTLARQAIERQAATLAKIMPAHMDPVRLQEIVGAQVRSTPKLLWCFETTEGEVSLLFSILQAAAAGLEIGGLSAEAYLIPYEKRYEGPDGKWYKRWEARLQVSDRGVRDLGRRDPRVRELVADVVREGDHFVNRRTADADLFEHEVIGSSDRPMTHAYCLIRWKDGGARAIVLDRYEVESIRDRYSKGYQEDLKKPADKRDNMWFTRPARAWAKTAIHQARRELDLTPEVEAVLTAATGPDDVPEVVAWPEPMAELAAADDDQAAAVDPWDVPPPPPANELLPEAAPADRDEITMAMLDAAMVAAGRATTSTNATAMLRALIKAADELTGVKVAKASEILADQATAEQLLVALRAEASQAEEGFTRKADVEQAIRSVQRQAPIAIVTDRTEDRPAPEGEPA